MVVLGFASYEMKAAQDFQLAYSRVSFSSQDTAHFMAKEDLGCKSFPFN